MINAISISGIGIYSRIGIYDAIGSFFCIHAIGIVSAVGSCSQRTTRGSYIGTGINGVRLGCVRYTFNSTICQRNVFAFCCCHKTVSRIAATLCLAPDGGVGNGSIDGGSTSIDSTAATDGFEVSSIYIQTARLMMQTIRRAIAIRTISTTLDGRRRRSGSDIDRRSCRSRRSSRYRYIRQTDCTEVVHTKHAGTACAGCLCRHNRVHLYYSRCASCHMHTIDTGSNSRSSKAAAVAIQTTGIDIRSVCSGGLGSCSNGISGQGRNTAVDIYTVCICTDSSLCCYRGAGNITLACRPYAISLGWSRNGNRTTVEGSIVACGSHMHTLRF